MAGRRICFVMPVVFLVLLCGCQPADPDPNNPGDNQTQEKTNLEAVFDNISKQHALMTDIPQLAVPAALLNVDSPHAADLIAAINEFNKYKESFKKVAPVIESDNTSKGISSAKVGETSVECYGNNICTYTWQETETLTIKLMQIHTDEMWGETMTLDGYDSAHHYEDYLHMIYQTKKDLSFSSIMTYQNPDHPTAPPGPGDYFSTEIEDASDIPIYDSSGLPIDDKTYIYTHTTFFYDIFDKAYYPNIMSIITKYPDGTTKLESWFWSFNKGALYRLTQTVMYDDNSSGQTVQYDEDGKVVKVDDWGGSE